jgi:hypothetical protein
MTIKSISGMIIDGVAASEAIDSSGEILDVKGCDTSDLENGVGVLNYEHRGDDANGASPNDVVGKIVFCKKIFKKDECDDKRQEFYWDKVKLPFIYIKARLYDGAGHPGAIAAAAMIRDHHANNEPILARYSIEGSTLKKEGNRLVRSMARKVALTLKPCNKSAISGLLSDPNGPNPVSEKQATKSLLQDLADTVKSEFASYEMEVDPLVKDESKSDGCVNCGSSNGYDRTHLRCVDCGKPYRILQKATEAGGYDAAPSTLTQGSALQREDLGPTESLEAHRERIRNQLKAALRDYDPFEHKDTKKFLKHYLPEADDSYQEYFENLVSDVKEKGLKQILINATTKMEYFQLEFRRLLKAFGDGPHPLDSNFVNAVNAARANVDPAVQGELGGDPEPEAPKEEKKWPQDGTTTNKEVAESAAKAKEARANEPVEPEAEAAPAADPAPPGAGFTGALPDGRAMLNGLNIRPGEGVHLGVKVAILGRDHRHRALVVPIEKLVSFTKDDIKKVDRYDIVYEKDPVFLDPPIVNAELHAHPPYTFQDEQKKLMDGINMEDTGRGDPGNRQEFRRGIVDGKWKKVLGGNEMAYVKPHAGGPSEMDSNAEAEGLYHNLMHQFFGTGQYIPTVAVFRNPQNGELVHVIRRVPGATHHSGNAAQTKTLEDLHDKGELDKLLLINSLLQNSDRHHNNFMFGNGGSPSAGAVDSKLFMIDHGFTFHGHNGAVDGGRFPAYYEAIIQNIKRKHNVDDWHEIKMHPEAVKWLKGLDPEQLRKIMTDHGAPPNVIDHTVQRLVNMKSHVESVEDPGIIEAQASAEPRSNRFLEAQNYRKNHDPVFVAAEKERKRLIRLAERLEEERIDKRNEMVMKLADLREDNPDMPIHDLAQLGGFNIDDRHKLQARRGEDIANMTPRHRAHLDENLDGDVLDIVGANQRKRKDNLENFINIKVGQRKLENEGARRGAANPVNRPLFAEIQDHLLEGVGRQLGMKKKPEEDLGAYRKRLEDTVGTQVDALVERQELEEAHGINDNRDRDLMKRIYKRHHRNIVTRYMQDRNVLNGPEYAELPSEEDIEKALPAGNDLDQFARAASVERGPIEPRNGRSDDEYRKAVVRSLVKQQGGWLAQFERNVRDHALAARETARSAVRSILDYTDGGKTPEEIKERIFLGMSFNNDRSARQLLSYYGIEHKEGEISQNEKKPIVEQLYQKLVNDPMFEKMAKERAKKKAFAAYQERQAVLKERQNRQQGQGKRRRKKVAAKVAEQKPVIQQKIDDKARPGTHGTPETLRKLRAMIAEEEAKRKLSTPSEQIRMFPKE